MQSTRDINVDIPGIASTSHAHRANPWEAILPEAAYPCRHQTCIYHHSSFISMEFPDVSSENQTWVHRVSLRSGEGSLRIAENIRLYRESYLRCPRISRIIRESDRRDPYW